MIGGGAFYKCSSLTAITLPDGVTTIGEDAFYGCSSLAAITIPDSVMSIGDGAFWGCSSLTVITIPNYVMSIGNYAFDMCSSLTAITIPDGVMWIGEGAFEDCSSLAAITIPDSVASIGHWAFRDCSALTKLSLSPAVSIGSDCFWGCTALITAAADQNMSTVSDLLHSRWHRIQARVTALLCLKGICWDHVEYQPSGPDSLTQKKMDGVEAPLRETEAREKIPKVLWRVILEFL
ncbi:hypothetical protein TrCOL_g6102 [Triparma columacea]|uniref:Leucine-rich repeat domain-containing protein n=1 Tax=Triparma columacea TaxID=722753 RepID=A0A9W7GNZ9_9STRA|nr:hypothetical protein TrCOL_g6102 [Triparma columacea]